MARDTRGLINVGEPKAEIDVFIAVDDTHELDEYLDKIKAIPDVSSVLVKRVDHDVPIYRCMVATVTVSTNDPITLGIIQSQLYRLLQR